MEYFSVSLSTKLASYLPIALLKNFCCIFVLSSPPVDHTTTHTFSTQVCSFRFERVTKMSLSSSNQQNYSVFSPLPENPKRFTAPQATWKLF